MVTGPQKRSPAIWLSSALDTEAQGAQRRVLGELWRSISAFDLIIVTMAVALALFHYWRSRDADSSERAVRHPE